MAETTQQVGWLNGLRNAVVEEYYQSTSSQPTSAEVDSVISAIRRLKTNDQWYSDAEILKKRVSYLFSSSFAPSDGQVAFLTYPLYVRDILEHGEINGFLHGPIVLVSLKLARHVLREWPVIIVMDCNKLEDVNDNVELLKIGNMMLLKDRSDLFVGDAIRQISVRNDMLCPAQESYTVVERIVNEIKSLCPKVAVSEISKGVFKIDRHEKSLRPGAKVVKKKDKQTGEISMVGPGESGAIVISTENDTSLSMDKDDFDAKWSPVSV